MKASIKGLVLEKFTKQKGKDIKSYIRLYQSGEKTNLDIHVSSRTFDNVKQGQDVRLDNVYVGAYSINNRVGMYAKEVV